VVYARRVVTGPLVETKFFRPVPGPDVVARPRLLGGRPARLTLVSAPAGFGKTTLLAERQRDRATAWVSLGAGDGHPATFWAYVVAALQRVVPGVGAPVLLRSARPPIEGLLATLVNDLAAAGVELDLVLDDYHLADHPEVHAGVGFLLEHLPPRVRLVIATRADPPLPLARLRARGELAELRAADLRFTAGEATAYLNGVAGLGLSDRDVAVLGERTEGWVAALQLAALSLRGRSDATGFIAGFAGDDRHVVDYLVDEVLSGQPEPVRAFLLRTSVLDRLTGPLCEAVTGEPGGRAMLEALDRANLFVVRLDDRRGWYRYHHLFADVLRAHLLDEAPETVAELHHRASRWFDRQGDHVAAVRHALAARDFERAADLAERSVPALRRDRQEAVLLTWLHDIPDEIVRARPALSVAFAGALLAAGQVDGVETRLEEAENRTAEETEPLRATIALFRAALALATGDVPRALEQTGIAIDGAGDDELTRAAAAGLRGLMFWAAGDLTSAQAAYLACVDGLRRAGHVSDVLGCTITLADILVERGRLREAASAYESGLRLAAGDDSVRGRADIHVGLSRLAAERNDLDTAERHLALSRQFAELPQNPYRSRVAEATIREIRGDVDGALRLLDEAERVYVGDFSPDVRPIAALRIRVQATHGRRAAALAGVREMGLSPHDELSYLSEFAHIVMAGVVEGQSAFLERLRVAASAGGRAGHVLEILVRQAVASRALAPLEQALALAEPEGYVRVFLDAGAPMVTLLRRAGLSPYVRRLLEAAGSAPPTPKLVDPLSERELDVLRLLTTDLDGPAIARHLGVSLNTVRTHTRNVYAKLGVGNRRAAVRRAGELGLLGNHHHMW